MVAMAASRRFFFLANDVTSHDWCVVSFMFNPDLVDRFLDTILYKHIGGHFISFEDYLSRDYHYFVKYQIGAIVVEVCSRDPLKPRKFFKQFLRDHVVGTGSI